MMTKVRFRLSKQRVIFHMKPELFFHNGFPLLKDLNQKYRIPFSNELVHLSPAEVAELEPLEASTSLKSNLVWNLVESLLRSAEAIPESDYALLSPEELERARREAQDYREAEELNRLTCDA